MKCSVDRNICASLAKTKHVVYNCKLALECGFDAATIDAEGGTITLPMFHIKWLRELGHPWGKGIMGAAAGAGNTELLGWLRSFGSFGSGAKVIAAAAAAGQLDTIKWLREKGYNWHHTCTFEATSNLQEEVAMRRCAQRHHALSSLSFRHPTYPAGARVRDPARLPLRDSLVLEGVERARQE